MSAMQAPANNSRQLLWFAVGVALVSGCLVAAALLYLRAQALESGQRLTESFAQVIEEQTTRTLQSVDQSLQMAADKLALQRAAGTLTEASARALLQEELRSLPFVRALWVTDARGRLTFGTEPGNIGTDLSNVDYFISLKARPETRFLVGSPVHGMDHWMIPAARTLRSMNGGFGGTIAATVDPHYFDTLWKTIDLGPGGSVGLFRRDAVMLMRSPFDERSMGKSFKDVPLFKDYLPQYPAYAFQSVSPIDGVRRVSAYRTLSAQPDLVVAVGYSYALMLQAWQDQAVLALSIWLAAASACILFCLFLGRAWEQRTQAQAQAEQAANRLQLATDAAAVGIWDWDIAGNDQWYASSTYYTMLGYKPEEGLANRQQWVERLHPDDRESVSQHIQAVLAGENTPYQYEARMRHADGSYRWIQVIGKVLAREPDGKPSRLMGVRLDITSQKQSEEQLRQSEETWQPPCTPSATP